MLLFLNFCLEYVLSFMGNKYHYTTERCLDWLDCGCDLFIGGFRCEFGPRKNK